MRSIYITRENHKRLRALLDAPDLDHRRDHAAFQDLERELNRAQVVAPQDLPPDAITMHSKARILDEDTSEEMLFRLVFPGEANIERGELSVLAPLGIAILGYRAGDSFEWKVPAGVRKLKVLEVIYQPEASGPGSTSTSAGAALGWAPPTRTPGRAEG